MSAYPTSEQHSLASLPYAHVAKGAYFSLVTEATLRECARAKLSGSRERVLIALLRRVKLGADGTYLVSRPAAEIAELLSMSESNVRRALSELCDPDKCGGQAPLRRVVCGRTGLTAVFALNFGWSGHGPRATCLCYDCRQGPSLDEDRASESKPSALSSASEANPTALQLASTSASIPTRKRFEAEAPYRPEITEMAIDGLSPVFGKALLKGWYEDEN